MKIFTVANFVTAGNLCCGCMGLIKVFENDLKLASALLFVALILDFFDGFIARILRQPSEIGKQLDSLADMVTFGVLPSFMLWKLQQIYSPTSYYYLIFILAVASAFRLAKFNIDERQTQGFIGLPTPANGMLVASFPFLVDKSFWSHLFHQPWFYISYIILFSYLLNSELRLIALKFKNFDWKNNKFRYLFIGSGLLSLLFFQMSGIPLIMLMYLLFSELDSRFS